MRELMLAAMIPAMLAIGCNQPEGETKTEKRDAVVKMNADVIKMFEEKKKDVAAAAKKAVGYACFSNSSVTFLFIGGGGGFGLATHNKSGKKTFMEVGSGNIGFGIGVKDYRLLMIFNTEAAYTKFLEGSWTWGGEASAEATSGEEGGGASASGRTGKEIDVYQVTDAGVILAATLKGGKFYRSKELN